jgi:hypothetical protein
MIYWFDHTRNFVDKSDGTGNMIQNWDFSYLLSNQTTGQSKN